MRSDRMISRLRSCCIGFRFLRRPCCPQSFDDGRPSNSLSTSGRTWRKTSAPLLSKSVLGRIRGGCSIKEEALEPCVPPLSGIRKPIPAALAFAQFAKVGKVCLPGGANVVIKLHG